VPGHAQLLIEPGKQCFIRSQLTFGGDHVTVGHGSGFALLLHQRQVLSIDFKRIAYGSLLAANRGYFNRLDHDIAGQRQISRVERIMLDVGQRRRLFDLPSRAPK
jgi:hypothetical protein